MNNLTNNLWEITKANELTAVLHESWLYNGNQLDVDGEKNIIELYFIKPKYHCSDLSEPNIEVIVISPNTKIETIIDLWFDQETICIAHNIEGLEPAVSEIDSEEPEDNTFKDPGDITEPDDIEPTEPSDNPEPEEDEDDSDEPVEDPEPEDPEEGGEDPGDILEPGDDEDDNDDMPGIAEGTD